MKKTITLGLSLAAMLASGSLNAQNRYSGYYKDIFMDSGIELNTYSSIPAVDFLGLTMERFTSLDKKTYDDEDNPYSWTTGGSAYDKQLQHDTFVGSSMDENGVLLYPDGAPRFRLVYLNGGQSTNHGRSLGPEGVANYKKFYDAGGSFVGTCAGSIMPSKGRWLKAGPKDYPEYFGAWPGYITGTGLNVSATGLYVEENCPLLKYYDFGGDMYIDSVRHNGGCYMHEEEYPEGTEILFRYDGYKQYETKYPVKPNIDKKVNAWAYKASGNTGRLVVTGSHPERMMSGERLQMFAAMMRYALDGNGDPVLKGELANGEAREMVKGTKDNDPAFTKIGDKQYHHFVVNVPEGVKSLRIDLKSVKGNKDYDMFLFAADGKFAFNDVAEYGNMTHGFDKYLVIDNPKAGQLYISVYCNTTVTALENERGQQYIGRTDVLNGVPYKLKVDFE